MSPRTRACVFKLLLFLAASSVTLAGLEAGLRFFLPQKLYRFPRYLFQDDPDLVFRLRPGFQGELRSSEFHTSVRINSLGLRGPDVEAVAPSTLRVLVIGDSFVSALNVEEEETFAAILGRRLAAALPDRRVEVINGGTPNYGTWHEVRLLKRLFPKVRPDTVVLCVFAMNDVENNLSPRKAMVRDGLLVEQARSRIILPEVFQEWLQRNSMAYVFMWRAWNQVRPLVGGRTLDPLAGFKALISNPPNSQMEDGYRLSGELLRKFRDYLGEQGVPALAVVIPGEMQVYPGRFSRWISAEEGVSPEEATARPDERWMKLSREVGMPAVDLLPLLRARAAGPYLYMSLDGHLTREGNRLAGEAIGEALLPLLPGDKREQR